MRREDHEIPFKALRQLILNKEFVSTQFLQLVET